MPITIKELHIKINVDEKSESRVQTNEIKNMDVTAIVAACVEEVMSTIERQKQR